MFIVLLIIVITPLKQMDRERGNKQMWKPCPPKNRKCVAWATRIDKQPWFVWHWPHGFSAVWPVPHEPRLFVNPCGWRSISSKFGGSPRRKVSILYPCSLETILDDFTLQKHVNVLPGPHGLTNSLKIREPGNTVVRRCCQVHVF